MGNVSYSAHISNGKSAITSKKALAGVAKHNLRKYKSADYSSENIRLIYGTTDLFQDVKRVYHREFDDVVKEYNSRQKREDRKIKDYFEHVAGLNQDMAVEIIFQCGDKKYWEECQTAHCGRCKPRFVLGEFTSPIVPYRNLPQTPGGMTADCRSLV